MCGRYFFSKDSGDKKVQAIREAMEREHPGEYKTGEILPGNFAPAVILRRGKLSAVPAGFGFPGFRDGKLIINARSETAAEKKTFADSLRERRIILPAAGFYEWSREGEKTKYFFTRDGRETIYLCGLWKPVDGFLRFVILTRPANASMGGIHDRMPVIVGEEDVRPYLTDREAAADLIAYADPVLTMQPAGEAGA